MKIQLLFCVALAGSIAWANDITTLDGRKFSSESISSVLPDGLTFVTSDGLEKVSFTNLTEEIQKKYHYDPAKAAKFQDAQNQTATQRNAAITAQVQAQYSAEQLKKLLDEQQDSACGSVFQITDEGALVRNAMFKKRARADLIFVYGIPKNLVDGDSWDGIVWEVGIYKYTSTSGATKTVRAYAADKNTAAKLLAR